MRTAAQIQEIPSANGRSELRGVTCLAIGIAVAWAGGILARRIQPAPPPLASHQQSAFTALDARDQGLFNDLRAAVEEIRALRDQGAAWPEPAVLAAQAIPPFVEDAVWMQRGRLAWRRLDAHSPSHAVYWGRNAAVEWALVLSGEGATVWRRSGKHDGAIPQAIPDMLVLDNWSEFVARNPRSK